MVPRRGAGRRGAGALTRINRGREKAGILGRMKGTLAQLARAAVAVLAMLFAAEALAVPACAGTVQGRHAEGVVVERLALGDSTRTCVARCRW